MLQSWKVFDAGPKSVQCPLIFLPPACGTADLYFRQLLDLSSCGYRVLSVMFAPDRALNIDLGVRIFIYPCVCVNFPHSGGIAQLVLDGDRLVYRFQPTVG